MPRGGCDSGHLGVRGTLNLLLGAMGGEAAVNMYHCIGLKGVYDFRHLTEHLVICTECWCCCHNCPGLKGWVSVLVAWSQSALYLSISSVLKCFRNIVTTQTSTSFAV